MYYNNYGFFLLQDYLQEENIMIDNCFNHQRKYLTVEPTIKIENYRGVGFKFITDYNE